MNRKMLLPTNLLLFLFLLVFSVPAPAYYDPGVQRWINRDPVGEPGFTERQPMPPMDLEDDASEILKGDQQSKTGEVNLYAFVENRPTNETDPLGLFLGFGYGNYCGWSRRGQGGAPIDALDAACRNTTTAWLHGRMLASSSSAISDSVTTLLPPTAMATRLAKRQKQRLRLDVLSWG